MTTPGRTPGPNETPYTIGSDWNQGMTEEDVVADARAQALAAFGSAFTGHLDLWSGFESLQDLLSQLRDAITKAEIPAPGPLLDIFDKLDGVDDGVLAVEGAISNLQSVINQIADIVKGVLVTPISQAVQDFKDGWSGINTAVDNTSSFVQNLLNAILQAIRKVPVVGGTLADIISEIGHLENKAQEAENVANTTQAVVTHITDIIYVPTGVPLWQSPDPTATVSTPWTPMGNDSYNVRADRALWASVRFQGVGDRNILQFLAYKEGTVSSFYVDVYKLEMDGSSTLLYSSPDLKDEIVPNSSAGAGWVVHQLSDQTIVADIGDTYEVQFRMGGSGDVWLEGQWFPYSTPIITAFRPFSPGSQRNPTSNPAPATIPTGTRDTMYSNFVPFVSVGVDVGQLSSPRIFTDTFDRTSLGGMWHTHYVAGTGIDKYAHPKLSGGRISGGSTGSATYRSLIVYQRKSRTKNQFAQFTLAGPGTPSDLRISVASESTVPTNNGYGRIPTGVVLWMDGSAVRLMSGNTQLATSYVTPQSGDTYRLEYLGDTGDVKVFRNGVPVWTIPITQTWEASMGYKYAMLVGGDPNYSLNVDSWSAGELPSPTP